MNTPTIDTDAFRAELAQQGFTTVLTREWPANHVVDTHTHDFSVRALVVSGDFVLGCHGRSQHLKAGDVFTLDAHVPHTEHYGPNGATYLVGRKSAA